MRFRDRRDAGRQLGELVAARGYTDPVVLALPRGGVPVGAEVARMLGVELDVLVVRKLGCPWQPELGVGAIGEDEVEVHNDRLIAELGISDDALEEVARSERAELERRVERYRGRRRPVDVAGRTALVIDDGIATGSTIRAAAELLHVRGAARVVIAVPVAPTRSLGPLEKVADEVVCVHATDDFWAIGQFYEDFRQTTDDEVTAALHEAPVGGGSEERDVERDVELVLDGVRLDGTLRTPADAIGLVAFAHGSGSGRGSPRNIAVAEQLGARGLATLLFDLLTEQESQDRGNVFDIELLGGRLVGAIDWATEHSPELPLGCFGASTGAAAALVAAADRPGRVRAVVSRGGRPDLASSRLPEVTAPTMLIVGGHDEVVLDLNQRAQRLLAAPSALEIVPGATHLFEEPGALDRVSELAANWFVAHLTDRAG